MHGKFIFSSINRFYYYGIILYILLCFLFAYLYINLPHYENRLTDILLSQSIDGTDASSERLIEEIVDNKTSFLKDNIQSSKLRKRNEKLLKNFQNRNISSVYVIFFSENQLFFLLDSSLEDRGEFEDMFKAEDSDTFVKAKESGSKQIVIQDNIVDLGFTLIKPIVQEGEPTAFLVIDYTQKTYNSLTSFLRVSVKTIMIFLGLVILLLTIILFISLRNSYIKNRLYLNSNTGSYYRSYLTDHYEKINFQNYYIALADIDFFKRINDLYGHKNGDKVIDSVIKRITSLLQQDDVFIQYGGEEFLLLISKKDTTAQIFMDRIEEIRLVVEALNIKINGELNKITISIGAFIQSEIASSLQDAIYKADSALYKSKHNGRNSIVYFDTSEDKKLNRERIRGMIESDKLVCFYQPIMSLDDEKVHHYEALLRLEDGDKIIFPDQILPDFEDSYFYSRISMRVIEYNVAKLREKRDFKISINLSSDDLLNDSIVELLIKSSDIANRMLIEILENKTVDYLKMEIVIQQLKLFGYKICIDDYGAGYSNLNHLLNLSIDFLKIDGSIIRNIHVDQKAHSLIQALTLFCQQNEIEVVAEFVENREIVEVLKGFGIEYGQGYYFDKAKPYDELGL